MGARSIKQLRVVGFAEGLSYLLLLFVAVPLKYLGGVALAVRVVGMIHGVLFLLYLVAVVRAGWGRRWPVVFWVEAIGASVVPFGPLLLDGKLRREGLATKTPLNQNP